MWNRRSLLIGGGAAVDYVALTEPRTSFNNFSPRLVVEYQANEDVLAYASVTRGFKSGDTAQCDTFGAQSL